MQDFKDYLEKSKIKGIRLASTNNEVAITTSLFAYNIFIYLVLLILVAYATYMVDDKQLFMIPILAAWVVVPLFIWKEFNYINRINIDFSSKNIRIISRNIFKKLFFGKQKYNFKAFSDFIVRANDSWTVDQRRYYVDALLKDKSITALASF